MSATERPFAPPTLASESRDRLLARGDFEAIWERDLDSDAVRWDGSLESMFGYHRDEVVSHISWWRERVHPDDLERVEQAAAEAIRGESPGWSSEYRFHRKDGSWAWVASRSAIERDVEGGARRAVGALIDISKLKETESRLRLFTEQIPARACATDRELRVVWHAGAAFSSNPSVVGKRSRSCSRNLPTASASWKDIAGRSRASRTDSISTTGRRLRTFSSSRSAIRAGT